MALAGEDETGVLVWWLVGWVAAPLAGGKEEPGDESHA
jgi:hypothetical protein